MKITNKSNHIIFLKGDEAVFKEEGFPLLPGHDVEFKDGEDIEIFLETD